MKKNNVSPLKTVAVYLIIRRNAAYLYPTVVSLMKSSENLCRHSTGARVKLVFVMHHECFRSLQIAKNYSGEKEIIRYRSDSELSIKIGTSVRKGNFDFLSFSEDGHLFSSNWLFSSVSMLGSVGRKSAERIGRARQRIILFPKNCILLHEKPKFYIVPNHRRGQASAELLWRNLWPIAFSITKEDFLLNPIQSPKKGFGWIFWQWYCEMISVGFQLVTIPGTYVFLRSTSYSSENLTVSGSSVGLIDTSDIFESPKFRCQTVKPNSLPISKLSLEKVWAEAIRWDPSVWYEAYDMVPLISLESAQLSKDLTHIYIKAIFELGGEVDYVFVMHQLGRGGSELEAIEFIRALLKSKSRLRIAIITDEIASLDWGSQLTGQVTLLPLARLAKMKLNRDQFVLLLAKILIQIRPRFLHIKHSSSGWDLLKNYGAAVGSFCKVLVNFYCVDYGKDGRPFSFAYTHLRYCLEHVSAIICDNAPMAGTISNTLGANNVFFFRFPTGLSSAPVKRADQFWQSARLQVLWASRIARQKNIELLFEIARAMPQCDFHMYGEFSSRYPYFYDLLIGTPNLKYYGGFDGFDSLPYDKCDVFLYTTKWDGTPNVLLEAATKGLPILAPSVGGIPELVNKDTGYIANGSSDYVRHLKRIQEKPTEALRKAAKMQILIDTIHSREQFQASVANLMGRLRL